MTITLCSPSFNPSDSYGRLASELATHLSPLTAVNCLSLDGDDQPSQVFHPALGGILLGYPTLHERFGEMVNAGPKLAITMFESTQLPEGWAEGLNRCDAVIVPAHFLVEIFRQAGVTVPLHVVPLGISEAFRDYTPRTSPSSNEPFVFLTIGDRGRRKGWVEAGTAFVRAFGDDPRYRLIIKAREFPFVIENSNITVIQEDMTNDQLANLYRHCHVMVFPSRGEGHGFPPREFVATGGLSLVTNWGGLAEGLAHWGIPIPCTTEPAWCDDAKWYGKLGEWALPDVEALAHMMKHVATHYDDYQDFRVSSADYLHTHTWDEFAQQVFAIWRNVVEGGR